MTTHFKGDLIAGTGFKVGNQDAAYEISGGLNGNRSTITVGTESTSVVNVAVQFNDANGDAVTEAVVADVYFSDDAAGQTLPTALDTVAVGPDGTVLKEITTGIYYAVISEADGDLDLNLTQNAADTMYMHIVNPDGTLTTSTVITFT